MTDAPAIYIAKESAVLRLDGDKHTIRKDITRVRGGHPLLNAFPDYFREVDPQADVHYDVAPVETARQDPGDEAAKAAADKAAADKAAADKAAADKAQKDKGGQASS